MAQIIDGRGELIHLYTRRGATLSFELDLGDPDLEASDVRFLINSLPANAFTVADGVIYVRLRTALTNTLSEASSYSLSVLDQDGEPEPIVYGSIIVGRLPA